MKMAISQCRRNLDRRAIKHRKREIMLRRSSTKQSPSKAMHPLNAARGTLGGARPVRHL